MSGPVPARWLHCPRKSTEVIIDKFIACKTPLSSSFDDKVPPECRFTPSMIFNTYKSKKIKIGFWIDLTNTNRFYDKQEIKDHNCKYLKLQCRGHGETPTSEQTETFIRIVQNFISQYPLERIVVHCTHGFNRTGFLIVSYLVTKMEWSLALALSVFAKARPPGIYKGDYLKELFSRYDDISDAQSPPRLPDWCNEVDDSSSNDAGSGSSYNGDNEQPRKRFKGDSKKKVGVFMEGIPGVKHFDEEPSTHLIQKDIKKMCQWKGKDFPGSQPVSMDLSNIKLLHDKPYRVSWKADGTRYMMLIHGENQVFFIDRDHCLFKIYGLVFPHRKEPRHLRNTLIDGEMVIDKVNGTSIPRYLAYDIICFEGQNVGKMPFYPTRLQYIENEIIKPRYMAMETGLINKSLEPFSVRKKDFWHVTQAASLLGEKFAKTLSHEPDGLIFQPSKEPYVAGRCDEVLKWKPPNMNSVDFRLKIVKETGVGIIAAKACHLFVGDLNTPFATMRYTKEFKDMDNKIVECTYENNQWKYMRERVDKSHPNGFNTAKAVYQSIRHPVTKEYLLDYINKDRFDDDSETMPPPSTLRPARR